MAVSKILLYYRFTPIADPEAIRVWQRDLCELLGLRGRILISKDGINGTVGGELKAVKTYWRKMRAYAPFAETDFKWSEGSELDARGLSNDFPRLVVKVRDEIVSFGAPDELRVDEGGVRGGGTHLSPEAVNELVAERADEVVFFDGRNSFEAQIGKFKDAVVPDAATTRDLVTAIDSGQYDHLKDKPIVTYCTGGVRCEVLSSLMISRGFSEVYQIDGGIVRYGERFGNSGLWEGSLYVFDAREALTFGPDAAVIGKCSGCGVPESRMVNCADPNCQSRVVQCADCSHAGAPRCERAHAA